MEPFLREGKMQDISHLFFRFTPCPRPGHRQRRGDTIRRKEQVAPGILEFSIKIEGEIAVPFAQLNQIGLVCLRRTGRLFVDRRYRRRRFRTSKSPANIRTDKTPAAILFISLSRRCLGFSYS